MKKTFLDIYNQILFQDAAQKPEEKEGQSKDDGQKKEGGNNLVAQKLEDAKKELLEGGLDDVQKGIAEAAYKDINATTLENNKLFGPFKQKNSEGDEGSNDEGQQSDELVFQSHIVSTKKNMLSNRFNTYYNLVCENEVVKQAKKTEDVQDGQYVLVVHEDEKFSLVNTNDPDTKFSEKDYKKVNDWIQTNKKAWFDCVKKYGGAGQASISDQDIDAAITKLDKSEDAQFIKKVITKVRTVSKFKELRSAIKAKKEKQGYLDDEAKKSLREQYARSLVFIITSVGEISQEDLDQHAKKQKEQEDKNAKQKWRVECENFVKGLKTKIEKIIEKSDDTFDTNYENMGQVFNYQGKRKNPINIRSVSSDGQLDNNPRKGLYKRLV